MDCVELGSPEVGILRLCEPVRGADGELWRFTASYLAPGVDISTQVNSSYATGFDDLVAYLEDLAQHWRGWAGAKEYVSLEGELRLRAWNDSNSYVRLIVEIAGPYQPFAWKLAAETTTDPGAQMTSAAAAAAVLLARLRP